MYKRIVVKIGSNVIAEGGFLDIRILEKLVAQVVKIHATGIEVVLVTSGAVAAGREWVVGAQTTTQVSASVGQIRLMSMYFEHFTSRGVKCAQVLLTKEDFKDKKRYEGMKKNFEDLFRAGLIPIVNENDFTAPAHEVGFSDNDELASLIASQINAEVVVFLSNVEGVLDDAQNVISEIRSEDINTMLHHIRDSKSSLGRGGMQTKFMLARKLMEQGITAYIADGKREDVIVDISEGKSVGTKFPAGYRLSSVKRRLAYTDGLAKGAVYVDRGAEEMLASKSFKSLLPVGITKVEGVFEKGDTIEIRNQDSKRIGSGVAQYDSEKAAEETGKKGGKALVHYDYLFIE